jgi:hypothetical protein
LAAHSGKTPDWQDILDKNMIGSTFWEKKMVGSTFWGKNMNGTTFWEKKT